MTIAVLRKDLVGLWATPVPYVVGAVFQAVLGTLMVDQLQVRDQAVIQPLFPIAGLLLLLVVPLITMRSFAEEARSGSLDLLLAVPVPARQLVAGKWAAAWLTSIVVLAPALLFAVLLSLWGEPDTGPVMSGFLGLVLLTAAASGIGILASACTSSQPVAATAAVFGTLLLWFAHVGDAATGDRGLLAALSLSERLRLFAGGGIDSGDAAFFACLAAAALVLAGFVVDGRRLR
jgi:ABC-2 type transport system permease protein